MIINLSSFKFMVAGELPQIYINEGKNEKEKDNINVRHRVQKEMKG